MAQRSRTVLNIRMTNGQSLRAEFDSDAAIYHVKTYVDQNRTDGRAAYNLTTAFPKQVFSDPDALNLTLELAGLCPTGTLIMMPTEPIPSSTQSQESATHVPFDYMQTPLPRSLAERPSNATQSRGFWYYMSYLNPMTYIWDDDEELAQYANQAHTTQHSAPRHSNRPSRGPNVHGFSSTTSSSSSNDDRTNQMNELQPKPGLNGWEFGPNLELEKYLRNQYAHPQANQAQGAAPSSSSSFGNTQPSPAHQPQGNQTGSSQPRRGNTRTYGARVHGFSDYASSNPPR